MLLAEARKAPVVARLGRRSVAPFTPMNVGQLHHVSTFCSNATLTLGAACQVMRRLFCCTFPRFSAGLLVSATYVHALGL